MFAFHCAWAHILWFILETTSVIGGTYSKIHTTTMFPGFSPQGLLTGYFFLDLQQLSKLCSALMEHFTPVGMCYVPFFFFFLHLKWSICTMMCLTHFWCVVLCNKVHICCILNGKRQHTCMVYTGLNKKKKYMCSCIKPVVFCADHHSSMHLIWMRDVRWWLY